MTALLISLALTAGVGLGLFFRRVIQREVAKEEASYELVECMDCGQRLSHKDVHLVIERFTDAAEAEAATIPGSGTAMIGEFCDLCCPGGCEKDKEKLFRESA